MKRTPITRKTRLRPVSKKRARENRQYAVLKAQFIYEHPVCWFFCSGRTVPKVECGKWTKDVHHKTDFHADFLNVGTWSPVCRAHHGWIEDHKTEAKAMGLIIPDYQREARAA